MSPSDDLRIDNLVSTVSLVLSSVQADKAQRGRIEARLERIERALALPLTYSLRQSCHRLGFSESLGHKHPERLPAPVGTHPLRYRIADVEAMVEQGASKIEAKSAIRGSRKSA